MCVRLKQPSDPEVIPWQIRMRPVEQTQLLCSEIRVLRATQQKYAGGITIRRILIYGHMLKMIIGHMTLMCISGVFPAFLNKT